MAKKSKEGEGEQARRTFKRHMGILTLFSQGKVLTASEACEYLERMGDVMDPSLMLRTLKIIRDAGFLDVVDEFAKPLQWRWPKGKKFLALPKMTPQEVLAFRLMERFLEPLLPPDTYAALRPFFDTAERDIEQMTFWAPVKNWENKVRVLPPAQPLLPPQPPPALVATLTAKEWAAQQTAVRDAILEALFNNRQCRVEYQQMFREEPTDWMIHPFVYLQRGPAFYVLCTINDYTDVRQLALHRMRSARVLDQKAHRPSHFNPDQEIERAQGMGGSNEPIRLVTRFWRNAGSHLLETRLSEDQVVENDEDSDYHFWLTATVNDTAQLRWWLLSFGQYVEVFEPEDLRAELANHAYWMHRRYARPKAPPASESPSVAPEA